MLEFLLIILSLCSVIIIVGIISVLISLLSLLFSLWFKQKQEKPSRQKFEDFLKSNHELFSKFKCANDEEIN